MAHTDSTRYPHLQDMLSSYWLPGGGDDEPLAVIAERVKADSPVDEVAAIRRDIAAFSLTTNDTLDEAFDQEFVSYVWPAGGGVSARAWLQELDACLAAPPDTSRDHRSGAW